MNNYSRLAVMDVNTDRRKSKRNYPQQQTEHLEQRRNTNEQFGPSQVSTTGKILKAEPVIELTVTCKYVPIDRSTSNTVSNSSIRAKPVFKRPDDTSRKQLFTPVQSSVLADGKYEGRYLPDEIIEQSINVKNNLHGEMKNRDRNVSRTNCNFSNEQTMSVYANTNDYGSPPARKVFISSCDIMANNLKKKNNVDDLSGRRRIGNIDADHSFGYVKSEWTPIPGYRDDSKIASIAGNNKFQSFDRTDLTTGKLSHQRTQLGSTEAVVQEKRSIIAGNTKRARFICPKCPAALSSKSYVNSHILLHGSCNPYRCHLCDYAVETNSNLIKHQKYHHGLNVGNKREVRPSGWYNDNNNITNDSSNDDNSTFINNNNNNNNIDDVKKYGSFVRDDVNNCNNSSTCDKWNSEPVLQSVSNASSGSYSDDTSSDSISTDSDSSDSDNSRP